LLLIYQNAKLNPSKRKIDAVNGLPTAPDMKSGCFFNNKVGMPRGVHQAQLGLGLDEYISIAGDNVPSAGRSRWKQTCLEQWLNQRT